MTDLTRVEHTGERATDEDRRELGPRATNSSGCARRWGSRPSNSTLVTTQPSHGLVCSRDITDTAVLNHVFSVGRITRAELSTVTGISKPTISDAVRQLAARASWSRVACRPVAADGLPPTTNWRPPPAGCWPSSLIKTG